MGYYIELEKLTDEEVEWMREEIVYAEKKFKFRRRVTLKKLARYLITVHSNWDVKLRKVTRWKDTHWEGSRQRGPGTRAYNGYLIEVKAPKAGRFSHDSTGTYRRNYEVAQEIIKLEEIISGELKRDDY